MKKGKTRKLTRRILSFVLTTALVVGLMPGNILTVSAEGTDTVISDELIVESVSSNDASATTECTCETDDPAFHATNCPAYIAPENPQCICAEKCTEDTLNVWCDVCGMQGVSACQGEDTAVVYTDVVASITNGETVTNYATFDEALANWTDGTTLTLLADVNLTERIKTYAKGLSLDLNGHKIECSDGLCTIWIDGDSGSELTIRDSQDGGHINGVVYAVGGESKLCLESGTVETVDAQGDFTMTGGQIISEDGSGLYVQSEGDVVISGGEIYGSEYGVRILMGNVIISGDTKITGADQYAIRSNTSTEVVISGTPTISGGAGEFWLYEQITLNTQPADGKVWRVRINTEEITDGIFAVPGEGIALDASKFASAMDGYEVKQNAKGELLLCNHTEQTAASNGDGTHNTTCNCGEATFDTNVACSGGVATDTHQAYCEYCNAPYGELNPDVSYDIIALPMTTEELEDALLELLNSGETDISILLAAKADEEMFTAINTALCSSTAVNGSVNLTIAGVQVVTNDALGNGHPEPELNTDPVALKTLNFPDAVTLELGALTLPNVQAVYLPKVTEWEIWGIDADNISTLVLTAPGTITADFTELRTYNIDLKLHCNKKNDVTDGTTWQGKTWKSISFDHSWTNGTCIRCGESCDHKDSAHTTATNNGNGTHSFTCTVCNSVVANQECTDEYSVVENKITKKCTACGEKGYIIITAEGGIYDGTTAYGATVEKTGIFANEEVTVNYYQGDTSISTDAPVDAGTYTAKITYEDVTASYQFTIEKVDSVITAAPTPIADLVYGGTAYYLINAGTATGGEMQYSLDGTNYSSAIPTGTDAKAYTVWYKVVGDKNHNDTTPASIEVTIAPKTLEIGCVTASDRAFDGTNIVEISEIIISGILVEDEDKVSVSATATIDSINIGEYSTVDLSGITLTGDAASNYSIVASAEDVDLVPTVTISKAAAPTLPRGSKEYVYNQSYEGEFVSITGLPTDCGGVEYVLLSVSGDMLENISVDRSSGKITYDVKALDSYTEDLQGTIAVNVEMENYDTAFYALDVTRRDKYAVTVKDGMSVSLETNELIYGQRLGELAFNEVIFVGEAGEVVTGTLMWEDSDEVPDVATDKASWRFIPDNDVYKEVVGTLDITVKRAPLVVEAAPVVADRVYNPSVTLADVALSGGTVKDEYGETIEGSWSWVNSDTVPTVVNGGYEAVFTPVDVNYETVTGTITVTVAKATPDIGTVSASNMENTLDVAQVVLSRSNETVPGTLSLAEGTTLQYGTKDYTYVFTPNDNINYETVTETVSITISDTNEPTATYKVGTDEWKQFINTITFGHFCKDYTTIDITYSDEGSGVADKQYYISDVEITNTENIQWSEYTDTLNINATGKYYIYVRVTDNYGNVVIQNSEGIVVYAESVITPTSFSCEYGEENDLSVNISANGNTFANLTDGSGNEIATENYSIVGSTLTIKGEYLSDLDVGEYTYKICMNPQGVENTEVTLAYSFVVNVTAKELTVTGATATSRDYIANDKTVDITGVTLSGKQGTDDVSVEITGLKGTLSSANAGDYTEVTLPALKLSGADKDNYVLTQPSKAVPTNVTISPQATGTAQNVTKKYLFSQENADTINLLSLLPKDCGTVVSYGTPAVSGNVTYKAEPSIEEGTLAYTVADGSEEIVGNKGTIAIDVKTQNYTKVPITISVEVVDQIPVTPQTEVTLKENSQKLTYGQKLSALELAEVVFEGSDGETVTGTLQWKNGDSIPTVDTKKATWEFVPSASYNDKYATEEGELTISVVPATPEVDTLPTVNAITYHPAITLADITLLGGKMNGIAGELTGTWTWKDTTICPKAGDNTYVAVFTPEDGTNYKTKEVDITVSVAKATPYIKTVVAADAITYGETLKDSALSGGVVQYSETDETAVAGSWSWKEETTKPVVTDSNVTEYDVVFTPTDADNYNKVETKITLTVNKSEITPNMPESTMSALFSQKTVESVELPEDWVWNEADSAKGLTVDVAVEATAIYNGADKGNYVTESVTISITRQACDHEESDILYTGEGEKAPTCTVDGKGHTECTKCKEPMQTNVTVEASGHTGGTATCKNKAECSVCHEGYGELDKNNHAGETEVKDAKKATCAVDGYTGDTYCKDCGAKIATGTKIDKSTAHTWDNGVVTKEATATEKGEKTYTCSVCKTTKKEEIPALGAPKVGEEIASEDGSATYKVTEAGENGNSVTYEAPTDKNQATVVVPATVTINNITYNVTTISDTAFAGNKKLTSVTIGDNVTGFSDKTFKGCSNLKTLIIGNGVTSIPANAFKNFKKLTTVKMGTGVKTIGKNAFYGCNKLKNLTLGKNVVTIGDKAFYKCTSLTKVTIPSKVKTIGKSTFEGCKALKTITIGKSVTKIGSKAFYGCSKTKTLTIKSSKLTTKKIGSKAFTKTPKSMTVKVPKKKFKAYKSMFIKRGVNKKAKFRKS